MIYFDQGFPNSYTKSPPWRVFSTSFRPLPSKNAPTVAILPTLRNPDLEYVQHCTIICWYVLHVNCVEVVVCDRRRVTMSRDMCSLVSEEQGVSTRALSPECCKWKEFSSISLLTSVICLSFYDYFVTKIDIWKFILPLIKFLKVCFYYTTSLPNYESFSIRKQL